MKKSLFALAAVGAFAGSAQAQSSVTVYGILDVGYSGVATRAPASATNNTNVTTQTNAINTSNQSTSRMGFRGTEDLGGGRTAFFTAEFAVVPSDATLSGNGNGGLQNRQAFVGLSDKGLGQAAIGTQYTPIHLAVGRTDPGQQNNISGNVIYTATGGAGETTTTSSYTVRVNNALTYQSPRIAGLQLYALYNSNDSTASTNAKNNNNAGAAGLNFVWQKLNFDAAYQTLKNTTIAAGAAGQSAFVAPTGASTNPAVAASAAGAANAGGGFSPYNPFGTANNQTQYYLGAVYDFGILKAYAQYINAKIVSNTNSNSYLQRSAQQIGVRGNITTTVEAWASGGNGSLNAAQGQVAGTARATQNFTGYQLGANYWMSKRTNAYAIFGSTQVSASSVAASEGRSSYGVGVRHTF